MNHRNVSIVGLVAVAAVLAGCAAQYRNPDACVAQMRSRLDETSQRTLKVTNRSVSWRGLRVVIEGTIEGGAVSPATQTAAHPSSAASAPAAAEAASQPKPTTPVGKLVAHFSRAKKSTATAAECTFGESGLTSFRWLAPASLAKTTPAPANGS